MKSKIVLIASIIGIPLFYAFIVTLLFGASSINGMYQVMSLTFIFCMPTIAGALTVYLSGYENARSWGYRIFTPWLVIFLFFFITVVIKLEGWACWLMVLPFFLVASSIGGVLGGYLKTRKKSNRLQLSLLVLLPFAIAPLENKIGALPGVYTANTYIDIHAGADKIWQNVTRVREIPQTQDKGWLTRTLGFPRPIKAELNYDGVGAHREAIFSKGLVFHETVLEYTDKQKMVFSIKAYPYEIPSTTMDEHVVIGGNYFDVLNGTYELEKLSDDTYRLHLYSHFKLSTTFNFYASIWAALIMKDIQNNILQIVKTRAEKNIQ